MVEPLRLVHIALDDGDARRIGSRRHSAEAPAEARATSLEALYEEKCADHAKLVELVEQFLAAREREMADWQTQYRELKADAKRKRLELEAKLEYERAERERERVAHQNFCDRLRAKHAEEWSRMDDERRELLERIAALEERLRPRPLWRAMFGRKKAAAATAA